MYQKCMQRQQLDMEMLQILIKDLRELISFSSAMRRAGDELRKGSAAKPPSKEDAAMHFTWTTENGWMKSIRKKSQDRSRSD